MTNKMQEVIAKQAQLSRTPVDPIIITRALTQYPLSPLRSLLPLSFFFLFFSSFFFFLIFLFVFRHSLAGKSHVDGKESWQEIA
jgi:hypothetical protein